MSSLVQDFPKVFSVSFSSLKRWDPISFHNIQWYWPSSVMLPIDSVLSPRKEKVDRSTNDFSDLVPVTIHFDGSIEPRKVSKDKEYTMDLFWARPGDIVASKIDLKNGAVAIIPNDWLKVVVTNHFAVYEPNLERLDQEYFHLLIQTNSFKQHLWRNKVGAEGRKEVKLDFFESLEVPIPPLQIQKKIVAHWVKAKSAIATAKDRAAQIEKDIHTRFLSDLGLPKPKRTNPPKCFTVDWGSFDRWSVSYNQSAISMIDMALCKYPVVELGSILELVQYGTSEKANTKGKGTPILRIKNIKAGSIDVSELKHISLIKKNLEGLRLVDGDILIIRTSGSRNLVGTCAVFHEDGEFVFASYLIRLRPSPEKALSDFVAWFINSPIGRQHVNTLSRKIMQNNINSEELRSLHLPLPPLGIQMEIMEQIEAGRNEIIQQENIIKQLLSQTKAEIEKMILGIQKI